ncbi:transglycosylase, partial [Mycobacterium sp. 2YAF39]
AAPVPPPPPAPLPPPPPPAPAEPMAAPMPPPPPAPLPPAPPAPPMQAMAAAAINGAAPPIAPPPPPPPPAPAPVPFDAMAAPLPEAPPAPLPPAAPPIDALAAPVPPPPPVVQPVANWDVAPGSEGVADEHQAVWALHTDAPLQPAPLLPPAPPAPPAPAPAPLAAPAPDPLAPINNLDVPQPAFDAANQAVSGELPVPAEVPHLSSPENLNPGTTTDRVEAVPGESPNVTYLKEIWHAIQTQDVSGKDALLALTQRPLTTPDARSGGQVPNVPGQLPPDPALAPPPPPAPAPGLPGVPPPPPPAPLPPA